MNLNSKTPRIELILRRHQVLNLDNTQHHMAIECRNGVIWVTCDGEHQDYMLRAGKRYVPKTKGTVVIEAIDEACVDIEEEKQVIPGFVSYSSGLFHVMWGKT